MSYTLDNFVRSSLSTAAAATDTSLVVATAAAPMRDPPDASAGAPGILVLQDLATNPTVIEIVTYTGRSIVGTQVTLTGVTRGCEGTTAQAWLAATPTFAGTTAAVLADLGTNIATNTTAIATNTTNIATKVAASGGATTLWTGTAAGYTALPDATKNASGFVAIVTA